MSSIKCCCISFMLMCLLVSASNTEVFFICLVTDGSAVTFNSNVISRPWWQLGTAR